MGIVYIKDAPVVTIHEAYGITLKGKYAHYDSIWSPEIDKCLIEIYVNDRKMELGNNCIFATKCSHYQNIEDDKDILCYFFAHLDKEMDDWEFEQFFRKQYHNGLWRYRTRNKMFEERKRKGA